MSGVNKNGIHWIKEGNTYYCFFVWGGIELTRVFENVKQSFIEKLDYNSLK
jgi:hypothetical protein